ncbi:outer membrane lipoprotein carrier protein LolA [Virgibacillus sp. YIM 98842]|uniref:LolA family protein n=1 Tax=Virgibacillus sp. YIM 98842 TaxID=2663533 RepID=UPI0013DB4CC7|nr:outer membrane lipoprotein carrier protein LolA [Virgibacillus sp. YIM 98842]
MKRMFVFWSVFVLGMVLLLSACGEQSQEDVAESLQKSLEEMEGYKAEAEMSMKTGQEDQTFSIDVWHKQPDFYRVSLSNEAEHEESQIILKNEDGVFVLTPALEKNFKFQSDWPENSSQPYLYQSLVNDVVTDPEAEFESTDSHYIFRTKTNYQSNNNLPFQEIQFDKKSYTPVAVKVLDHDGNALVEVNFSSFDKEAAFEDDDFTMEKNMAGGAADEPTSGQATEESPFTVVFPSYMAGAELTEQKEVELENGKRVILSYTGDKNFTLIQEQLDVQSTLSSPEEVNGDIVNLGHSIGAISENMIEWSSGGMDFILASDQLTQEEMVQIAQSVENQEVK